jgi:pimeloyl-ACP methyl ester carboxylesterase
VRPGNAEELLQQWLPLHGFDLAHPTEQAPNRRSWGRAVECVTLPKGGHEVAAEAPEAVLDFWGIPPLVADPAG